MVGHSLGGRIIQHLLARGAQIDAAVLIASVPPRYPARVLVGGAFRHRVRATRRRLGGASTALFREMTLRRAPRPTGCPHALVVAGSDDHAFRVSAQSRLARRLGAELAVVRGGHDLPLEDNWRETAADIAAWLEMCSPGD